MNKLARTLLIVVVVLVVVIALAHHLDLGGIFRKYHGG